MFYYQVSLNLHFLRTFQIIADKVVYLFKLKFELITKCGMRLCSFFYFAPRKMISMQCAAHTITARSLHANTFAQMEFNYRKFLIKKRNN